MKETVNAAGRGETKEAAEADGAAATPRRWCRSCSRSSVTTSPLHALCDVGGEGAVQADRRWVGK